MTIKTTYNRRSFLKTSAMTGGGMMLGFSWLASCKPTPEEVLNMPKNWFDINAFLKIGENGVVTIMSPNPEIGQNVKTSMPMIVAEELDVDWKQVVVEQAGFDISKYTRQLAGGSGSIREGWQGLRMAGATARKMLVEAAAQKWGLPADELSTDSGFVFHKKSKQKIGYGELASAAAKLEIPKKVKLKEPKDFKIIGSDRRNVDGQKIVTGEPLFGLDYKRDGMLVAMIEHPPAFGLKLKSLDASKAIAMPGIKDVFTFNSQPEGFDRQWSDTNAFPELVAIVGNSTWQVLKAKKALNIEWEKDSDLENSADHEVALAALQGNAPKENARKDGNPDAAFKEAHKVIERTYSAPLMPHNTMEPMNYFADVKADRAELIGPVQTPEYLSKTVASVLGLPEEKVSIMMTRMGGGFGRRLYGHFGVEAAVISQKIKAPVKLVYTREDDMTQGTYRPAYRVTFRAALDKDNKLTAFHVRGGGIGSSLIFENRFPAGTVENYLAEKQELPTNISTGAWRAPRSHFMAIAEQSFLDEVAEAAGKDPIDFRLELFDRAIKKPVGKDNDYDAERYAGVLKLVKEKAGWGKEMPGVHRGVSAYYCHRSYVAQVVDVVMEGGLPRVQKVHCAVDCGIVINPLAARNQIEGGIVDGIGHALFGAMTFKDGQPQQSNFDKYRLIRHAEAPLEIETHFVDNGIAPTGLGEPSLPPIAAALANAMYKATGKRLYEQPFVKGKAVPG
ncbi:MAG TPA: xanthine dehydrogenase family protein molybdopterin-binding subunit [Bacteroidetes bacterium]|nr:xanthine dehydrogenase family protein molybdopterin-binding subunit [Bacteroidota bacterium]